MSSTGAQAMPTRAAPASTGTDSITTTSTSGAAPGADGAGTYVVQVAGAPIASYDGSVKGYRATRPPQGRSIDPNDPDVRKYRGRLKDQHAAILRRVPGAEKVYDYQAALNGFAVELTATEAVKLSKTRGVLRLWKNEVHQLDTTSTPDFLGLTGRKGVWRKQFHGQEHAGEGVIVGIVDSGFWPENPSFAPLPQPRPDADVIEEKWHGTCNEGADADPDNNITCNNKVIGAYHYNEGVHPIPEAFDSPRDLGGHGSHTASTAVGNAGVEAEINDESRGKLSGMSPAARLAVYKVCWETEGGGGCSSVDSVAAINQAVADGVDVINYSISGSRTYVVDPVEIAFYNAARAGVFVAASAGNSGPGSTVAHNSPWLTTVAASTHDRAYEATVTLGNGKTITGAGLGKAVAETDLVLSQNVGGEGAKLCAPESLDPAKVENKIVACARGTYTRVAKSREVARAGGAGMVLYNTSSSSDDIASDFHHVPTVHVELAHAPELVAYAETDGATAALTAGERYQARAPKLAAFSSSGPARAGGGDLLKPDITAPGVDVIAAVAPPGNNGANFASYQGTSMSGPHIAGLAALLASEHPRWRPMWIKSALMTTASQTDNEGKPIARGGEPATPLDFGAGHVVPSDSFDPGLVYDSGATDWIAYMCALGQGQLVGAPCDQVPDIDPSDLDYPSIAIGDLAGGQTVTRTVTNPTTRAGVYRAAVDAPAGTKVEVSPRRLVLPPGASEQVEITISRTTAEFDTYTFGSLTWRGVRGEAVRSPIAIRPVQLSAPAEVRAAGTSGSKELTVTPGFSGTLESGTAGLVPATVDRLDLKNPTGEGFDTEHPATNEHVGRVAVTVPEDSSLVRFATYAADYEHLGQGTDVDLFVYRETGEGPELVGVSASGSSDESVTLTEAGDYEVYVDLWALPSEQDSATVQHYAWVVGDATDNVTVEPASQSVTSAEDTRVTVAWQDLEKGRRYLGAVLYGDGAASLARTILSITG